MTVTKELADIIITNQASEKEFKEKIVRLLTILNKANK
jgi:hypothetical protein